MAGESDDDADASSFRFHPSEMHACQPIKANSLDDSTSGSDEEAEEEQEKEEKEPKAASKAKPLDLQVVQRVKTGAVHMQVGLGVWCLHFNDTQRLVCAFE